MTAKKAYSRMGFATLAFMASWNAVVLGLSFILVLGFKIKLGTEFAILLNLIGELLVGFPLFYLIARKVPVEEKIIPERNGGNAGFVFKTVFVMFGISIVGGIISTVLNSVLAETVNKTSDAGIVDLFESNFVLVAINVMFVAPIVEEYIMRKMLIDRVVRYGKKTAMIMSGILFGLLHGNLEQFFYTFFVGMVFAYVYIKTGKLRYPVFLHFVLNSTSTLLSYCMSKIPEFTQIEDTDKLVEAVLKSDTKTICFLIITAIMVIEYLGGFIGLIGLLVNKKRIGFTESTVEASELLDENVLNNQYIANEEEGTVSDESQERFENYNRYGLVKEKKPVSPAEAIFNPGMISAFAGLIVIMILSFFI